MVLKIRGQKGAPKEDLQNDGWMCWNVERQAGPLMKLHRFGGLPNPITKPNGWRRRTVGHLSRGHIVSALIRLGVVESGAALV